MEIALDIIEDGDKSADEQDDDEQDDDDEEEESDHWATDTSKRLTIWRLRVRSSQEQAFPKLLTCVAHNFNVVFQNSLFKIHYKKSKILDDASKVVGSTRKTILNFLKKIYSSGVAKQGLYRRSGKSFSNLAKTRCNRYNYVLCGFLELDKLMPGGGGSPNLS